MNLFHSRVELYDSVLAVMNVWGSNSSDLKNQESSNAVANI
jgi:hypothetical protein